MRRTARRLTLLAALSANLIGCTLPSSFNPVSRSLNTCRQLTQRGIAAAERGQRSEAEALLADAVKACSVDAQARRHYAETLWARGADREAIAQMREASRLAGSDPELQVRLAEMFLATGEMREAVRRAEKAIDLNPRLAKAWAVRGHVMRAEGKPQQAMADFHRALGRAPDDREILLAVAELHRELDQPRRALTTLQRLADSYGPDEQPPQVHYLTGLAQMALSRPDEALAAFSTAAVSAPTAEIYRRMGEAELLAGRDGRAAEAARHALSLQPNHPESLQLLAHVERLAAARRDATRR